MYEHPQEVRKDAIDALEKVRRVMGWAELPEHQRVCLSQAATIIGKIAVAAREQMEREAIS